MQAAQAMAAQGVAAQPLAGRGEAGEAAAGHGQAEQAAAAQPELQAALEGTDTATPGENDGKLCSICEEQLGRQGEQQDVTLSCGHVFHAACVQKYMEVTCLSRSEACPHKCHRQETAKAAHALLEDPVSDAGPEAAAATVSDWDGDAMADLMKAAQGEASAWEETLGMAGNP